MRTTILFVAAAMTLSTAFGNDPGFEERFKMKTGRYTPTEEARREQARIAAKQAKPEPVMRCDKHGCCTRKEQAGVGKPETSVGDPWFQERYKMKNGRYTPAEEERIAASKRGTTAPVLLASAHTCEGDCCKHHQ